MKLVLGLIPKRFRTLANRIIQDFRSKSRKRGGRKKSGPNIMQMIKALIPVAREFLVLPMLEKMGVNWRYFDCLINKKFLDTMMSPDYETELYGVNFRLDLR